MPVRANLERPDYIGAVGQSLGGIANVVDQLSPMDPRLQRAIFEVIGGGDPKQVAAALRGGMQAPEMPSAPPATGSRQMQMPADRAAGDVQHPFPMTNLRTPRLPSRPSFSEDMTVTAPTAPATEKPAPELPLAPFARRDAPMLMQLAQLSGKHNDPLAALRLELGRDTLDERIRQFNEQAGIRGAREDLARAAAEGIPERIELAKKNYLARLRGLNLTEQGLDLSEERLRSSENERYLKATREALQSVSMLGTLISRAETDPEVALPDSDYARRRLGEMMSGFPLGIGKFAQEGMKNKANEKLTPKQLGFRHDVALAMQNYTQSEFGKSVTGVEKQIADMLAGETLSFIDTVQGMKALRTLLRNRIELESRAYPKSAETIGTPPEELPELPANKPLSTSEQLRTLWSGRSRYNYTPPSLDLPDLSLPEMPVLGGVGESVVQTGESVSGDVADFIRAWQENYPGRPLPRLLTGEEAAQDVTGFDLSWGSGSEKRFRGKKGEKGKR